jgi:hypothetical protein
MKKLPNMFGVMIHPPGRPGHQWLGCEASDMITIRTERGIEYTAPLGKVYATVQRWHAREHPTGRKRQIPQIFGISEEKYRVERDMISAAKWAILRGIPPEDFVASAHRCFKQASNLIT